MRSLEVLVVTHESTKTVVRSNDNHNNCHKTNTCMKDSDTESHLLLSSVLCNSVATNVSCSCIMHVTSQLANTAGSV